MRQQVDRGVPTRIRRILLSSALMLVLLAGGLAMASPDSSSETALGPTQDASSLFQTKCSACHTIGGGDIVGPDLAGVTTRRDRDWLVSWLADPPAMIADGDPIAVELLAQFNNVQMPALGLTDADVESLVAYFEEQDGGTGTPVLISEPGDGDANAGRNLFTGANTLDNGGPSCRACHSIAGIGALGGGKLGPDLTTAYNRLGDGMIAMPQTGTMQPIFTEKLLTEEEQTNLLAFFRSTDITGRSSEVIWQLGGLSVAGVVIVAALTHLIWRRRLTGVRIPMVTGRK
ncbi:MAG: cytochrome c [Dehalococcoidia bacterium]|jgi:mono/diheme cytochrome c family protein|nr:cytochrome c [Dehalococcoidia bacterium]